MKEKELLQLVKNYKSDNIESTLELINRFTPLIKKYKRLLDYEDSEHDIIVDFLSILSKTPTSNEGTALKYISLSMRNAYIKRSIKNKKNQNTLSLEDYKDSLLLSKDCFVSKYEIHSSIEKLSDVQKNIILGIFFYGFSVNEIAKELQLTRQTIFNQKKKALEILKNELM